LELAPTFQFLEPGRGPAILADLTIECGPGVDYGVRVKNAGGTRIANVEVLHPLRAGIYVERSYGTRIWDCAVSGAQRSDGGYGYGVVLVHQATRTTVKRCQFEGMRHAMIVGCGATRNDFLDNWAHGGTSADIAVHGHWPSYNVWERNDVDTGVMDNVWGPNGPGNVFRNNWFRGRLWARRPGAVVVAPQNREAILEGNTFELSTLVIEGDGEGVTVK
jgi:hypothetical protein